MRSLFFICWLFGVSLCSQSHGADGGIFTLLLTKPFVAEATATSTSPGSFKLSLRTTNGRVSTFETVSSHVSAESQFVDQMKSGRSYAFPQCLVDFLGFDKTVSMIRSMPVAGSFSLLKPQPQGVMDLGRVHPFRAMVLDQALGEEGYSIVLQAADSGLYHVSGLYGTDRVKRIAGLLKRGEIFEFPAALDDLLLTPGEREAKMRSKSPEAAVLARYLGAWSGTLEDDPKARVKMNCHWLADGSGIWREITFDRPEGDAPPVIDIARVTYDAGKKAYVSEDPGEFTHPVFASIWDEATQTFTTGLGGTSNDETLTNTATFTREDRIDWKTVTRSAEGKVVSTRPGSYVRTARSVPAIQLPPASTSSSVTFTPSGSGQVITTETIATTDFFKLREDGPFRAKITALDIQDKSISADLEGVDLRRYAIRHEPGQDWDKALSIAKRLVPGTVHEFPAALADDYQAHATDSVAQPTTDAMRALSPFIGQWRMHWTKTVGPVSPTKEKIIIHYFWSHDGTGLWREVHLPAGVRTGNPANPSSRARVDATLTTYNPASQRYIETASLPDRSKNKQEVEWDAQTQTYSLATAPSATSDLRHSSARKIVSPDRIEFHSKSIKPDGSLFHESGGYYERIQP